MPSELFGVRLDPRCVCCVLSFLRFLFFFFFFFFFTPFPQQAALFMYGTWTVAATFDRSSVNSASVHYSRTHKFHFLSNFSLKMGLTVLFTHLKIILLQYFQFSVFSFSKISSIQTDPWYKKQGVQQKWPIKNPIIHLIYTSILSFVGDVFVTMAKMQD